MKKYITLCLYLFMGTITVFSQEKKGHDSIPQPPNQIVEHTISIDTIYSVEVQAYFPGGDIGWRNFLMQNLNTDVPGKHHAPKGRYTVKVTFIVDKDGTVSDVTTPIDPGYGTGEEVIRVLKKSPKWNPGSQNGKVVKSWRNQSISFVVD